MIEQNNQTPWELVITNCLAEIITSEEKDKILELRISALFVSVHRSGGCINGYSH